jgi:hypothetical protein
LREKQSATFQNFEPLSSQEMSMLDMLTFGDANTYRSTGFPSRDAALALLDDANPSPRLMSYVHLVESTAAIIIEKMSALRVVHDAEFVRVGVVLHDIGMVSFPEDFGNEGSDHEKAGETMLLLLGIDKAVARCCVSHAQWADMPCCLEELVIALSTQLWNGQRCARLEFLVINALAKRAHRNPLEIYSGMTETFDRIAQQGLANLMQLTGVRGRSNLRRSAVVASR